MNTLILTPEAMFQGDLLLVNPSFPHHPLPHPDLVTVADTDILLERRAAQALDSLMAAIGGWEGDCARQRLAGAGRAAGHLGGLPGGKRPPLYPDLRSISRPQRASDRPGH